MKAHTTVGSAMTAVRTARRDHSSRLITATLLLALASSPLSGCSSMQFRVGEPLDMPALEQLQIGTSTAAEITAALGEPQGTGRAQLPFHPAPREMWTYYYEVGNFVDSRRTFLFVFLDEGIFDGYTWLSSLPAEMRSPGMAR